MATKKCPNGHIYDPNVYGDNCPFCPSGDTVNLGGGKTKVNDGTYSDDTGGTKKTEPMHDTGYQYEEEHTHIGRRDGGTDAGRGRKLVALLVSYDTNPEGEVYRIYEGRNSIGRKSTADICVPEDNRVSGMHMTVLYREAEGIFWAIDNDSSNGTFVNGSFVSKAELHTEDTITVGDTNFTFIIIPKPAASK